MQSKEKNMDLTSTENEAAKKAKKADKWADKPAMEVRDLHFAYGKNKVLKGVSLKIEEGKITTIMGANGCGKSTLFSLMTKNLYPGKGNIFLKGKNIQNLNLKEFARKVAIVQQYNSASDDITVENLVAFGRTPHKKMMQGDSAEDERMIEWALEVTNLMEYWKISFMSKSDHFPEDSAREYGSQWHFVRGQRRCSLMSRPPIWISGIRLRSCSL